MDNSQEIQYQNNTTLETENLIKDNVKRRLLVSGYTIDIVNQPEPSDGGWLSPLNLRFAGISKYIPLSDIDIEIKDTDIGFSIDQTIKNVLKINKEDVDLVAAYWPLYTYIHDREKRYTTDNKLLPINGGYFAGFIFAEERYFPFNSKALDKIKSESYLKENLTPALNRLERLVDGEFVGVILKKNGEKIRDSWFINKEETHLNSTIEYILGVALNQQIV